MASKSETDGVQIRFSGREKAVMVAKKSKLAEGFVGNRHGLPALKRRVAIRGLDAFDLRSAAARRMIDWRDEFVSALGGQENVTPQEYALLEMLIKTRLLLEHVDGYVLGLDSLVNRKKHALKPIVRERLTLVDTCSRLLSQLGLQRREKPVPDLDTYLSRPYNEKSNEEPTAMNADEETARPEASDVSEGIELQPEEET
jgi:hypothetical protein